LKFSSAWLRDLVPGLEIPPIELKDLITLKTAECEGIRDGVIEIDNKSITHRPDLWGHLGMAREVAAILKLPLRDPVRPELIPGAPAPFRIEIEDFDLCPRYSGLLLENVTVAESPAWLRGRLAEVDLKPINNVVDVTNFVMAELAQPMHAFDRDRLQGNAILVRSARPGERLVALDEREYGVGAANLVIADAAGPVALAGVIGGLESAIGGSTRRVVLESANFNATSVRRTSAALKIRTDASMRFEKSQDPENTVRGLARALELLEEVSPGLRVTGGLADSRRPPAPLPVIALPLDWLNRKLGSAVDPVEVRDILERLRFGVTEPSPGTLVVTVPSWRATRDIAVKDDLVEEVGRMIGYDSIEPQAPLAPAIPPPRNPERIFERDLRSMMAAQGFTEVYNYSFVSQSDAEAFGFAPAVHLAVANPIASDQTLLRTSLLPGIRRNILENRRHFESFRIFEIGREIHPRPGGLPVEKLRLAAAIYAAEDCLLEMKRVAECLMENAEVRPSAARPYEHPARAGEVLWRARPVGRLFELHPALLDGGRAAILDLDLEAVLGLSRVEKRFQPLERFPSSEFDLSVVAPSRELVGDHQSRLASLAGPLLQRIRFLRQYTGAPLPEGSKSVSFRLTVGSAERTLELAEVNQIRARVIHGMRQLGYDLRV